MSICGILDRCLMSSRLRVDGNLARKELERFFQPFLEADARFPTQQGAGFRDVGAAAGGVVDGQRLKAQFALGAGYLQNRLRALRGSVNSVGLPMFTGRCSLERDRRTMPSIRSST